MNRKHFEVVPVGPGAWACVARPGRGAVGNAGFVVVDEGVVVFDTSMTPQAAAELRAAAETQGDLTAVINSHWHPDHVRGNQVFSDVPIYGTETTRQLVATNAVARLHTMRTMDRNALLAELEGDELATAEEIAATIDEVDQIVPGCIVEGELRFGGARVFSLGGGHTASDALLLHEASGILFTGDLVVTGTHPSLQDGNPIEWRAILDQLQELPIDGLVPGHGEAADPTAITVVQGYLRSLIDAPESRPRPDWAFPELHYANLERVRALRTA